MTAKINNGTTETQTRLVRWKRRVLGFEGADVTLYLPISHGRFPTFFTRGEAGERNTPTSLSSIRAGRGAQDYAGGRAFLAHPSRMLGNPATLPFNYNSCGLLPFFRSFYVWRWSVFGSPRPQPVGDDTSGPPYDLQEGTNAFVAGSAEHVHRPRVTRAEPDVDGLHRAADPDQQGARVLRPPGAPRRVHPRRLRP